ncbi:MAG: hypothetical protein ACI3XP_00660 [Eubacteriales bacterium]
MEYIYIFLTRTGTRIASAIGAVTGDRFAHASLSLDRGLHEMYSFARRGLHNPFRSGFEKENIHRGIFALFGECRCVLYRLPVADEVYARIRKTLESMYREKYSYRYNFIGLFSCAFGIPTNTSRRFTCSQFVSWVLETSGAAVLPKNMGLMKPDDLASLPGLEKIYEGRIAQADLSEPYSVYPAPVLLRGRKA